MKKEDGIHGMISLSRCDLLILSVLEIQKQITKCSFTTSLPIWSQTLEKRLGESQRRDHSEDPSTELMHLSSPYLLLRNIPNKLFNQTTQFPQMTLILFFDSSRVSLLTLTNDLKPSEINSRASTLRNSTLGFKLFSTRNPNSLRAIHTLLLNTSSRKYTFI